MTATATFLNGGGNAGQQLREHDWSRSALGHPQTWPQSLRTSLGFLLAGAQPACLVWGPERLVFCNDACVTLPGMECVSSGFGGVAREVFGEEWMELGATVDGVMDGAEPGRGDLANAISEWGSLTTTVRVPYSYLPVDDAQAPKGVAGVLLLWHPEELSAEYLASRLAEMQERLDLVTAGECGVGMWDWDVRSDSVVSDEPFARLFGIDPKKAETGVPIAEFLLPVHPEDRDQVLVTIDQALRTGDFFRAEYRLVAPDGKLVWIVAEGKCRMDSRGRPKRFPGIAFDITERKRMESELLELHTDLERKVAERALQRGRTWQVSPDLLGVVNLGGYFEASNPAWQKMLGWSEAEVASKRFSEFVHPDDLLASELAWESVSSRGLPSLRFENRLLCKGGTYRWLSWISVPEGGKVYCSARDITDDKERTEALATAESSLRQSQKMEAVGQLTGGLAHDFNNLLTTINGSLELLERSIAAGQLDKVDRLLTMARGSVKRAAGLTHRLLAFSRLQTLAPKPVNVNRLIADMEELISRTVGPEVHLKFVGADGLWATLVDPGQLENALLNLCINARDAMPGGGRLTIQTTNHSLDPREAKMRDLPPGQFLSLCVIDTGVGMQAGVIAKAFDPFYTTKPLGSGTGLGLSMVHGFARQSGGNVHIDSELGQGTTLCLYLPRYDGEVEAETADVLAAVQEPGEGEVLLVIDDEPTIRALLVELLREAGYQVFDAPDGPAGLRLLQTLGRLDLLITDVGLPGGMNGRQVADAARASRPELKVLFITGYAENAAVGNQHTERWMSVLTKPFELQALTRQVKDILAA